MTTDTLVWFELLIVTLLGLSIGSFTNTVIFRVPRSRSVIRPRSMCPHCETPILSSDNVPVVSYILLRGRCRSCKARISLQYPAVEGLVAALFLLAFLSFGPTWSLLPAFGFIFAVIALSFIDVEHRLLPDVITYPGLVLSCFAAGLGWSLDTLPAIAPHTSYPRLWCAGLIAASGPFMWLADWIDFHLVGKRIEYEADEAEEEPSQNWLTPATFALSLACALFYLGWSTVWPGRSAPDSTVADLHRLVGAYVGAFIAGGMLWSTRILYYVVRRSEGTGFGDIKMMFFVGAFLGWRLAFLTILAGSVLGSIAGLGAIIRKRDRLMKIPFGIFLGAGALIGLFLGARMVGWYFAHWIK